MSGTMDSYIATRFNAFQPAAFAERAFRKVVTRDVWYTERDILDVIDADLSGTKLGTGYTTPRSGGDAHLSGGAFVPQAKTYAEARLILQGLTWYGIVERRTNPETPLAPDVRWKTRDELAEQEQACAAARNQGPTREIVDADGLSHSVPVRIADDFARRVTEELRRRRSENTKADLDGRPRPFPNN